MEKNIRIGKKIIGDGNPCFIIAEAGANFKISDKPEENLAHALKLIDHAVEAKADAVKFQLFKGKGVYVKNAGFANYLGKNRSINDIIKDVELPYAWLNTLKTHCDKKDIIFLCSAFDEESVEELEKNNVLAYKVASYEISHIPLITYIAKKGKPIIFSTGASTNEDIQKAINAIKATGNNQIIILQCTAKYPAPLTTINLKVIPYLKQKYGYPVGLSDHSRIPALAPVGAVALGANVIEKHFTTNNNLPGPDHKFAILPH